MVNVVELVVVVVVLEQMDVKVEVKETEYLD